jgi:hypothetical protein
MEAIRAKNPAQPPPAQTIPWEKKRKGFLPGYGKKQRESGLLKIPRLRWPSLEHQSHKNGA